MALRGLPSQFPLRRMLVYSRPRTARPRAAARFTDQPIASCTQRRPALALRNHGRVALRTHRESVVGRWHWRAAIWARGAEGVRDQPLVAEGERRTSAGAIERRARVLRAVGGDARDLGGQ